MDKKGKKLNAVNPLITRRDLLVKGAASIVGLGLVSNSELFVSEIKDPEEVHYSGSQEAMVASSFQKAESNHFETEAIHAGEDSDCSSYPVYQGSNNHGIYSRGSNPVIDSAELKINLLEGAEKTVATACGMAAISSTLLALLRPGMRIIYHRTTYSGTRDLMGYLRLLNITCDAIDMTSPENLRSAIAKGKTDIVYFEVHTNHLVEVIDLKACAELAHNSGAMVVVDNTWLTPYLLQPLAQGADIVLHSATKYMMGHGNGLVGVVSGSKEILTKIESVRHAFGTILSPMNAALLHQGLKTLPMRMEKHCTNAMKVAEFLSDHPKIAKVHYPGLPGYPGHETAKKQVRGYGGMVGFETRTELKVWEKCKLIRPWWSLGDVETLMAPWIYNQDDIKNYIRMSVGLEHPDNIIEDLKQALNAV